MKNQRKKICPLSNLSSNEPLELSIDKFSGRIHIRHFVKVYGEAQGKKFQHVTKIMDIGPKKGSKSHREYGHNRKFIFERFKTEGERTCAYIHNLGDFLQDRLLDIIAIVGEEFKKGKVEGPFYEQIKDGKWGWDIKKDAIDKLVKESSRTFIETFKKKNRVGESNYD